SIWGSDHFFPSGADDEARPFQMAGQHLEGWTLTAALAHATRRLRLGPLVTCVAYRNPGLFANMVSTVDTISDGRLELALGCGWNELEAQAYGMPLGSLTDRMDRFEEHLSVLVSLFTAESTTFSGRFYRLENAGLTVKPVQRPHPPVVIGGVGERRTIPLVARFAQHWNMALTPPELVPARMARLAQQCASSGRDPVDTVARVMVRHGTAPRETAERAAAYDATGLDLVIISLSSPLIRASVLEPLAHALLDVGAEVGEPTSGGSP